jgi:hypothetical protein
MHSITLIFDKKDIFLTVIKAFTFELVLIQNFSSVFIHSFLFSINFIFQTQIDKTFATIFVLIIFV